MKARTFTDILKFNPYHDERGRFASANSYASFTYKPGKSRAHDLAIQRHQQRVAEKPKKAKPKELKTEKAFDQHAKKYENWEKTLSRSEREAIGRYETESFAFNHKLRNLDPADYDPYMFGEPATRKEYKAMDSALAKSKVQDDVVVFRSIPDVNALGDLSKLSGATIKDKGYASTSLDKNAAMEYGPGDAGIICKINVKKGSPGAYISGIKDKNGRDFTRNREILLPRDAQFKVVNVSRGNGGLWEVEMDYEG